MSFPNVPTSLQLSSRLKRMQKPLFTRPPIQFCPAAFNLLLISKAVLSVHTQNASLCLLLKCILNNPLQLKKTEDTSGLSGFTVTKKARGSSFCSLLAQSSTHSHPPAFPTSLYVTRKVTGARQRQGRFNSQSTHVCMLATSHHIATELLFLSPRLLVPSAL